MSWCWSPAVREAKPSFINMSSEYDIADLAVVHYDRILQQDADACHVLLEACREWGFFYLDFGSDDEVKEYFHLMRELLDFSRDYFAQSIDEKLKDTRKDFATFNICG
jgi:isopenicillin N synthase-like dioxygenase